MTPGIENDDGRHVATGRRAAAYLVAVCLVPLVIVSLVVGLAVGIARGDADERNEHRNKVGLAAAPLELDAVSADIASHFTFAHAHEDAYEQIPCYCGCEKFLAHRNLYDCFVRSDGKGWDAHAAGCGVCIGESVLARRLLDQGEDPLRVRDDVIRQFGSTPATTPPA